MTVGEEIDACKIARLEIHADEVLVIQPSMGQSWTPEQVRFYAQSIEEWANNRGKSWHVLPLASDLSITVVPA